MGDHKAGKNNMENDIFQHAFKYRQRGLSIIPITPRGKTPLIPSWLPYQDRLPTEQELAEWFKEKWPSANIGIITGKISNLAVIDVDSKEGEQSLVDLIGNIPETPISKTPKGMHLFFRHPGGIHLHNFARKMPGLDFRGDGGYVVASPSIGSNGDRYKWISSIFNVPLAPLPKELLELITQAKALTPTEHNVSPQAKGWLTEALAGVPQGQRNDTAARLAGFFLRKGLSYEATLELLKNWNLQNTPPLSERELITILNSIRSYHPEIQNHWATLEDMANEGYQDMACYLEPELLGPGDLMVIGGSEGIGKTLLVTHLALCLASGEAFFRLITKPVHIYLIQLELPYERFKKRHWPLIEHFKNRIRHTFTVHRDPRNLKINVRLFNEIKDVGAKVIIIDPFTHVWGEGYEQQSRAVIDLIDFCRTEQIAAIVTHHRRKVNIGEQRTQRGTDTLLGSGHLKNQAATIALVSEIHDEKDIITTVFEFHKTRYTNKYASILAPRWLRLNKDTMAFQEETASPGVRIELAITNSVEGELAFTEIQERLACHPWVVNKYLKKLIKEGKIRKHGKKYQNVVKG